MRSKRWLVLCLVAMLFIAACGGDDGDSDEGGGGGEEEPAAACSEVETVEIEPAENYHVDGEYAADDYSTSPPAGGVHSLGFLSGGAIEKTPPPLGDSVHSLEHGSVIIWTNEVPEEEASAIETFVTENVAEDPFNPGDKWLEIMAVENNDMDTPIAFSAWGALQKCNTWDEAAAMSFLEEHYASGPEGEVACGGLLGPAATVPGCENAGQ